MAQADAHTRDWLKALGALIAPSMTQQEFAGRINVLAAALAREFPPGAFCPASLAHVARQCKFFPNFAELCEYLSPWWKEHRPKPIAIAADQNSTIKARQERADAEASWRDITDDQIRAKVWALNDHPMRQQLGHFLATAINRHVPEKLGMLPPEFLTDLAPRAANDPRPGQDRAGA